MSTTEPSAPPQPAYFGSDYRQSRFVYGARENRYRKKRFGAKADIDFGKVALEYINVVIEMCPNAAGPYYDRGTLLFHLGEVQAAIKDFTHALEINGSLACAHSNRGLAFNTIDQPAQAICDFTAAIEIDPNLMPALFGRGIAYSGLCEYAKAEKDFSRCIELDSNSAEYYILRARMRIKLGQFSDADIDLDFALLNDPTSVEAHLAKAFVRLILVDYFASLRHVNLAIEIDSEYAPAFLLRSEIGKILGHDDWRLDKARAFELDGTLGL